MNNLVEIKNGKSPTTTSKLVADKFKKQHRLILDMVKRVTKEDEEFGRANFSASSYVTEQNKTLECFDMTMNGYSIIAMGLTGADAMKWKIKFINAFDNIASALSNKEKAPKSMLSLNELTKAIESDKDTASLCGKHLQKYKTVKKENDDKWKIAVKEVQLSLGFK